MELTDGKAEVQRLADDLGNGGGDEFLLLRLAEAVTVSGDESALAAPELDKAVAFEELVGLGDGQRVDVEFGGEVAHGGELLTVGELAGGDALLELPHHLPVDRLAALRVEVQEHEVVYYNNRTPGASFI